MNIVKSKDKETLTLSTQEVKKISNLNPTAIKILKELKKNPTYPKQLAKNLKIHEQNIYYYIRQLESNNLIKITKTERLQGTVAKYYKPTADSFFIQIGEFEKSSKLTQNESEFLKPFIENGHINATIVVGSPDPHGPEKARARDGYFGMDLALFLGTHIHNISHPIVKLDTEFHEKEISDHNLIIIGGPIVNKVASLVNKKAPIHLEDKTIKSTISKKKYTEESTGFITKFPNPYNKKKSILYIAGIRNSGTRAAITTFLKHFEKIEEGNITNPKMFSKVVEGIDLDSDGVVDDSNVLE